MSTDSRIVHLAILESYGVEWPLETFARDVLQNFFDATPSYPDVTIDRDLGARALEIRGPSEFDVDLLAYLGATTKHDGRTAGGFGEGFKICALVGARDFGLGIRAGSGDTELEVFFEEVPLGRELCYRVARTPAPGRRGSYVRLDGCSDAVFAAFDSARHAFFHDDNPYIGEEIATDEEGTAAIYASNIDGGVGEIYYRRQFRGDIAYHDTPDGEACAITLACHVAVDDLEGDRDRRELDPVMVARIVGARVAPDGLHIAILALEAYWSRGHDVLSGLLTAAAARGLTFEWPVGWVARTSGNDQGRAAMAERQGFRVAMAAFGAIGMRTVAEMYRGDLETRTPTPRELARIDAAVNLYSALYGAAPPDKPFEVFDSKRAAVHGQHLFDKVIVASNLLRRKTFAAGASTVIHELCHEAGGEDDPAFLNRLGRLLGAALRNEAVVVTAREAFENAKPRRPTRAGAPQAAPPPAVVAYRPGEGGPTSTERSAVECCVFAPPGFPPADTLMQRITAAAAALGRPVNYHLWVVPTYEIAKYFRVPGLPTVRIDDVDLEPEIGRRPSLRLRTFGPERSVVPSEEALLAGFDAALKRRRSRRPATRRRADLETERRSRNETVSMWLGSWALDAEPVNERTRGWAWQRGLEVACKIRLAACEAERAPTADELYSRVTDEVTAAVVMSEASRAEDGAFEAGDGFEEDAMGAAQAAFVTGFAAGGRERADHDFRMLREATAELLAIDASVDARGTALRWCIEKSGFTLGYPVPAGSIDAARFREAFAVAKDVVRGLQLELDQQERLAGYMELERALERATPGGEARLLEEERANAGRMSAMLERERRFAEGTHLVRATWETTLAATRSEALAGEACMRTVKRWFRDA